jgi:hypothetical protein
MEAPAAPQLRCAFGHASATRAVLQRTPTILTQIGLVLESRKDASVTVEDAMGPFKPSRVFDPLDLEIMDRVYEAAWAAR